MAASRTLYVGGLAEEVNPDLLQGAFVPFGEVKECKIPTDPKTRKHKGFGFIEFLEDEDWEDWIENMHESELFGRTLTVNLWRETGKNIDKAIKPLWWDDFFYKQKLAAAGIEVDEDAILDGVDGDADNEFWKEQWRQEKKKRKEETTREKNARKEKAGQATFSLKWDRDTGAGGGDVRHDGNYEPDSKRHKAGLGLDDMSTDAFGDGDEKSGSGDKGGKKGKDGKKGKGKNRVEETRMKRMKGQSGADHLGTTWKSDQEMHMRDNFD